MSSEVKRNSLHFIKDYIFPITERETLLAFKADEFIGPYIFSCGSSNYINAVADFIEGQRIKQIESLFYLVRLRAYHDEYKTVFSMDMRQNLVEGLLNILPNAYLQIKGKIKASKRNIFPVPVNKRFELSAILSSFKNSRTNEHNEQFFVQRKDSSRETSFFEFDIIVGWSDLPKTPQKTNPSKISAIQASVNSSKQNLYEDEATKDLVIVVGNGTEIKCHRIIFSAHTDALSAIMPSENTAEQSEPARIEMADNSEDGVRYLLRYLYGMELSANHLTCGVAVELFQTANKYKLNHLRKSFSDLLIQRGVKWFTPEIILKLYFYIRDLNDFEKLKNHSIRTMSGMNIDELRSSDGFCKLDSVDAIDLLCKLVLLLQKETITPTSSE